MGVLLLLPLRVLLLTLLLLLLQGALLLLLLLLLPLLLLMLLRNFVPAQRFPRGRGARRGSRSATTRIGTWFPTDDWCLGAKGRQ